MCDHGLTFFLASSNSLQRKNEILGIPDVFSQRLCKSCIQRDKMWGKRQQLKIADDDAMIRVGLYAFQCGIKLVLNQTH